MLDDVLVGLLIGGFAVGGITGAMNERGLAECEKNLPRTHTCEKVWVPKAPAAIAVPEPAKEGA